MQSRSQVKRVIWSLVLATALLAVNTHAAIKAQLMVTKQQVQTFCGTSNVKLVFTDKPDLYYVDFSAATPAIVKINGASGGILASISPDGQWIVYEKGPSADGATTASTGYLCRFDSATTHTLVKASTCQEPRFVQNPLSGQMEVIYGTVGGNDVWNGQGQTVKMAAPGGVPSGSETVVCATGSWLGGVSWDNRYLCAGLQEARMYDLNTSTTSSRMHVLTFVSSTGGPDSTLAIQCCNPSRSASRVFTNTMMYLDFGFPAGALSADYFAPGINGGQAWAQHGIIYIGRNDNTIIRHYVCPGKQDFDTLASWDSSGVTYVSAVWDDPEWSNHPYFASASAEVDRKWRKPPGSTRWEHNYNKEALYLIDLQDSTYLQVIRTTDVNYVPAGSDTATSLEWSGVWIDTAGLNENAGWLPISGATRPSRTLRTGSLRLSIDHGRLASSVPLRSVTMYNMLGGKMSRTMVSGTSVQLAKPSAGVYFVEAQATSGDIARVRWTVAR